MAWGIRLITDVQRLPGARILDGQFSAVQQAIGIRRGRPAGAAFLREFVEDSKSNGSIAGFIEQDIRRFDIAMDDALVVGRGQGRRNLIE